MLASSLISKVIPDPILGFLRNNFITNVNLVENNLFLKKPRMGSGITLEIKLLANIS